MTAAVAGESPRALLRGLLDAALAAAQPALCVPPNLPPPPRGRTLVLGAGKASAAMARALEEHWSGELGGLVVTRHGYALPCARIEIVQASHPVPDEAGLAAAARMLAMARGLGADDLVIGLFSGGGSALLPLPARGLTLAHKQAVGRDLLRSGASIHEINCVRRHLSAIKGGRLGAACHPAPVATLAISDVPGDFPWDVASGPTVADPSTSADAIDVLERYRIAVPAEAMAVLRGLDSETVKPGDPRLARAQWRMVSCAQTALEAAARLAPSAGLGACILGDAIEGEAREVARVMAGIALQVRRHAQPLAPPCVLLSGGETTVTVSGTGRGGRNVEFLLALALALEGAPGIHALAADTDGVDGTEEVAGAFIAPDTLARARAMGLSPRGSLAGNDAHGFFGALGDSLVTGPTMTNVNDFRAILVL